VRSERGSTTIMAIGAMVILTTASAAFAYVTNRNINITKQYTNGLQAQYSAEAAVRAVYVAGKESITKAHPASVLDDYPLKNRYDNKTGLNGMNITLPNKMGNADIVIKYSSDSTSGTRKYDIQAKSTIDKASRLAYNTGVNYNTTNTSTEEYEQLNIASLINTGSKWDSVNGLNNNVSDSDVNSGGWKYDTTTGKVVAQSPGYNSNWLSISSQTLFNDKLGLSTYSPKSSLQLVFRVNYYITLMKLPSSSSGCGYGVYYLAKKTSSSVAGDANKPTAYVVQYDPGLNPDYGLPSNDWVAWGASFKDNPPPKDPTNTDWPCPYGAFLVKKAWGGTGAQNEVWDENSGNSYNVHYAFQDNSELTQRYYDATGQIQPDLDSTDLVKNGQSSSWALKPVSLTPGKDKLTVLQVPTAFGYNRSGTFSTELTENYHKRPPDLRIPYTLGNLAEGNPWQPNTYYPLGSKVAVGVWVDDALNKRLVWVATKAGVSGGSKPSAMKSVPSVNATVKDGDDMEGVTWTAQLAPTPEAVANSILSYVNTTRFSIAKISMADLKFRVDSVNGNAKDQTENYSTPFAMLQGKKNKITIELWADNLGNRIQIIRVNDVVALGFNDRYESTTVHKGKHNIIGKDWELTPATEDQRSTGIRVWNAAIEFYSSDNYGQTMTATTTSNYGIWGK